MIETGRHVKVVAQSFFYVSPANFSVNVLPYGGTVLKYGFTGILFLDVVLKTQVIQKLCRFCYTVIFGKWMNLSTMSFPPLSMFNSILRGN